MSCMRIIYQSPMTPYRGVAFGIIEVREAEIKQLYPEGTRLGAAEKVHWGYTIVGSSNCGDVTAK